MSTDLNLFINSALLDHALKAYSTSSSSNAYLPERARTSFKRSYALRALGREDDAQAELQEAFEMYQKILGRARSIDISAGEILAVATQAVATERPDQRKVRPEELVDQDFDDMIAFWSK